MTPTKDDALAALDWLEDILQGCVDTEGEHNEKCRILRAALTQPRETFKPPYIVDDEGNIAQLLPAVDYDLIAPVAHYFNGDAEKTRLWFETPNPNLGGVKPIDTPRDRLLKFITEQTLTQPPVDVEALKVEVFEHAKHYILAGFTKEGLEDVCCVIDYLVSKGYLK